MTQAGALIVVLLAGAIIYVASAVVRLRAATRHLYAEVKRITTVLDLGTLTNTQRHEVDEALYLSRCRPRL